MSVLVSPRVVSMIDVDLVQINFARYFSWMGESYDALLRELGHPLSGIIGDGRATPVVDARCEYIRPIGLDHRFDIRSAVFSVGRTSYVVAHRFEDADGLFAIGRATHVWIRTEPTQSPAPAPDWLRLAVEPGFLDDVEKN